ncbi:MAG: hypothetical protein IH840_11170 [Candidatus Heimdallarchaeota archaeon]|nr:hypothetical protein [Candidatus Heimdallarchaeota archaeon]
MPLQQKWRNRLENDPTHQLFKVKWLTNLKTHDLSNPAMGIVNGWMSEHDKNQ